MSVFEEIFSDESLDHVLARDGVHEFTLADYTFLKFCRITVDESLDAEVRDEARKTAADKLVSLSARVKSL